MITFKTIITYSVILFALLMSNAIAGDSTKYSTEEIAVFGNTGIKSISHLPGFVQIVDGDQIVTKNGNNLSDVLKLFAGVSIREYGGGPSLNTVSMNGSGAEHTLILIDGAKLNSVQNNQFDVSMISKDNIRRIEVLSGGMSSIYGSEAIGGVINIVTNKASSRPAVFGLSGGIGSFGLRSFGLNGMKSFGNLDLLFKLNEESSENNYEYVFHNGNENLLKQRENSAYKHSDISASLNLNISRRSILSLSTNYIKASRDLPGIETGSSPSNSFQKDALWRNSLSLISRISKRIAITGTLGFTNDLMNYNDNLITQSFYKNMSITGSADAEFDLGVVNGNAGIELNRFTLESNETVAGSERLQPAVYAGAEFEASDGLRIFPSVRIDHFSDIKKTAATANLGINFKPLKSADLYLKARAGNNFAAPSFNELYWKTGGNQTLDPEKSFNYSLGVIYEMSKLLNSSLEISYTKVITSGKIVWTPKSSGYWTPENLRETESDALIFNMSASKDIASESILSASFSFTYTDVRKTKEDFYGDRTTGKQLVYVPQITSKAGLNFTHNDFKAGLFYEYIGRRYMNAENTRALPQTGLLEASMQYSLPFSILYVTGRLEANNILNEDYQMIAGYPMPLRNFTFKLNLEYR